MRKTYPSRWIVAATLGIVVGCAPAEPKAQVRAQPGPGYVVVARYPHDPEAFTQGLAFRNAALFEGTGLEGQSTLRRVDLPTGEVLRSISLSDEHFGEGITLLNRKVYQLTWQSGVCFVYRARTFASVRSFRYEGEGWGLTDNGRRLIMSDGTNMIRFRDPATFDVVREIAVTDGGEAVSQLNELEWIGGEIFANVWQTDDIVRIDPKTGEVIGRFNVVALREQEQAEGDPDVTNGIAYLAAEDRLFVTGKRWSHLYEIRLTDGSS